MMRTSSLYSMAAGLVLAAGLAATPMWAGNPAITNPPKPAVKAAAKPKEFGGAMPLPVDQKIERQNSPQDKLVVEVTHSAKVGTSNVAYVKIVWGDLDNVLKKDGAQFYSKWDGNLKLTSPARGAIDEKVQFDDGKAKAATKPAPKPAVKSAEPKVGSGRDEVEIASGATVVWESGVVGALDGLRVKITSASPTMHGILTVGKFTIPINITGASGTAPVTITPPGTGTVTPPPSVYRIQ